MRSCGVSRAASARYSMANRVCISAMISNESEAYAGVLADVVRRTSLTADRLVEREARERRVRPRGVRRRWPGS